MINIQTVNAIKNCQNLTAAIKKIVTTIKTTYRKMFLRVFRLKN